MKLDTLFTKVLMIFCLVGVISCKDSPRIAEYNANDIITLNIREAWQQQERELLLSDLTDNIKYIPLETNEKSLLYGIYRLMLNDEQIFISDGMVLYHFDLSGRFIRQIGRHGKGPGDHGNRIKVAIQNEDIYILSSTLMNIYDLETGIFKRSFNVGFDVSDFIVLSDLKIVFFTTDLPAEGPLLFGLNEVFLTDSYGEVIDSIGNYSRLNNKTMALGYVHLYRHNSYLNYMYNHRDTLYSLLEDFSRSPKVIFNFNNTIDRDKMVFDPTDPAQSQLADFIWVLYIMENDQYIFLTTQKGFSTQQRNSTYMLYDKYSGDLGPNAGFRNNVDGGLPFWPKFYSGNKLITSYQPYEIIEHYESTIGSIDHSDSFIEVVKSLKESDNPVLVFVE